MKKYKLINLKTGNETICFEVELEGHKYYVSDEEPKKEGETYMRIDTGLLFNSLKGSNPDIISKYCRLVIATTNTSIDCPQVVDEVDNIGYKWFVTANKKDTIFDLGWLNIFKGGYKKAKEEFGNSDEDMINFYRWLNKNGWQDYNDIKEGLFVNSYGVQKQDKELIKLFKEETKTIYYE